MTIEYEQKESTRRPRFRRTADVPPFRLTNGDIEIVQLLARHRFLRSTHIAELVGRSVDRINDRLLRLFHAGYVDRPRAQLDRFPTSGSAPIVYSLASRGVQLVGTRQGEQSRNNRTVGRQFIEHQLEIVDFRLALSRSVDRRSGLSLISADELAVSPPNAPVRQQKPFALRAEIGEYGAVHIFSVVPDVSFGIRFADDSRRCYFAEVDRGTMPVSRTDVRQTSFERKMRIYLAAHRAKLHEALFGWRTFRVLVVTTDWDRVRSMISSCKAACCTSYRESSLFMFAVGRELASTDPLSYEWHDANGHLVRLI